MKRYFNYIMAIAVCAGFLAACSDDDPVIETKDELSVKPATIAFEAADTKSVEVEVTKTAATYDLDCKADWVVITESADKFTVSVREYTEAEAEEVEFQTRSAEIKVTSGTADAVKVTVSQTAPDPTPEPITLSVEPDELTFAPETTSMTAQITTNSEETITATIPSEFTWITSATVADKVLTVTVESFVGTQNHEGHIFVGAADAEDFKVAIVSEPIAPLNLAGNWTWTGQRWDSGGYTADSGTLTATYDEALGGYIFKSFTDHLSSMSLDPGAILLEVDEDNNVTFTHAKRLDIVVDWMGIGIVVVSYRNCFSYMENDQRRNEKPAFDTKLQIAASNGGSTLTFPAKGTYDGMEYDITAGFGGVDYAGPGNEGTTLSEFGIWKDLVLTRAE